MNLGSPQGHFKLPPFGNVPKSNDYLKATGERLALEYFCVQWKVFSINNLYDAIKIVM